MDVVPITRPDRPALIWISRFGPGLPDYVASGRNHVSPRYLNSQVTLILTWTVAVPASIGTALAMALGAAASA